MSHRLSVNDYWRLAVCGWARTTWAALQSPEARAHPYVRPWRAARVGLIVARGNIRLARLIGPWLVVEGRRDRPNAL